MMNAYATDYIEELEAEIQSLKDRLSEYERRVSNTPPNTAMLLGAALSGGDALALAKRLDNASRQLGPSQVSVSIDPLGLF